MMAHLALLQFAHPWLLLTALAALPAWYWIRRSRGRVRFSSLSALPASSHTWRTRLAWLPDAMIVASVVGLAIAFAGPRMGDEHSRVHREGIAMVMAVDTSGSMRALDLSEPGGETTRLGAVKKVFEQFVLGTKGLAGRPDDAIGLVSFAGHADPDCPLTLDHSFLIQAARELEFVKDPSDDGTALGDGLALAVEKVRKFPAKSKVIVLLTDGVENAGRLGGKEAADLAAQNGVKVYTVGAGTNGMAPIRDPRRGNALMQMPVEIDEDTLRAIATKTGGQYFRATDGAALKSIYAQIDKLERTKIEQNQFLRFDELYYIPLALGLLLVCLAFALRGTLLRRLP